MNLAAKRHTFVVGLVSLLCLGWLAPDARATLIVPMSLEELTSSAQAIFLGRVADVRAQWAVGRRQIESLVTLDVDRYVKGDFGPTVVIKVPGGELGAYRSVVIGAPAFAPGDEVVLFVAAQGPAYLQVVGFNQGVFRVVKDTSDTPLVIPPPHAARVSEPLRLVRGDPHRRVESLDRFLVNIRSLVDAGQQASPVVAGLSRPKVRPNVHVTSVLTPHPGGDR